MEGADSTPNTMRPSGKRLPGPCVKSIQRNWPARGVTPQRHDLCGSRKPSTADATQITGMPTEKYHDESQASRRPLAAEMTAHVRAPITMATVTNQASFFFIAHLW